MLNCDVGAWKILSIGGMGLAAGILALEGTIHCADHEAIDASLIGSM